MGDDLVVMENCSFREVESRELSVANEREVVLDCFLGSLPSSLGLLLARRILLFGWNDEGDGKPLMYSITAVDARRV